MSACQATENIANGRIPVHDKYSISTDSISREKLSNLQSNSSAAQSSVFEDQPEILGSVVHCQEQENGDKSSSVQLRTSARVSKKMRLDVIANQTPPEKKEAPKEEEKQDTKPKRRPFELWPQEDKNTFFEALNEFGKDFDGIQRYFEAKAKRKNVPDHTVKNKEQIRHFYYRTWHKISKHLRFPDEVKKATQELYGLINFGELRKKIGTVSEKTSLRLNELIYRGFTTIRIRGKNIRVKTPICRALRKLNQQEDLAEDLKLPPRVIVELRPRTNEAWARVQATAQNPRVQTQLPLQRRLSVLLSFLERRWQPQTLKHCERLQSQLKEVTANMELSNEAPVQTAADSGSGQSEGKPPNADSPSTTALPFKPELKKPHQILRIAPLSDATITPLTINLSEYFTSSRLSLNSHEGRLGNHGAEELFNSMLLASTKGCGRRGTKRLRNDSWSEKRKEQQLSQSNADSLHDKSKDSLHPIVSVPSENGDEKPSCPFRIFGSEINLDACSSSADLVGQHDSKVNGSTAVAGTSKNTLNKDDSYNPTGTGTVRGNSKDNAGVGGIPSVFNTSDSPEETIKRVRAGWTLENANAITIGELYLMCGADSKIKLEYWWDERQDAQSEEVSSSLASETDKEVSSGTIAAAGIETEKAKSNPNQLSMTLQKLLLITKMFSSQAKCPCGHVCNGTPKSSVPKAKVGRSVKVIADIDKSSKVETQVLESGGAAVKRSYPIINDGPFRRPLLPAPHFRPPPRPGTADAFKAQLEKFRPRGCNRRGRTPTVKKNVVVPRMLPLLPKAPSSPSVITLQMIPQATTGPGDFLPISQSPSILNFMPSSSTNVTQPTMSHFVPKISDTSTQVTSMDTVTSSSLSKSDSPVSDISLSMPDLTEEIQSQGQLNKDKSDVQQQSCHLVQDLFPPTLDTPVNSPPSMSNLFDLSLPSELGLNSGPLLETNFSGLLPNSGVTSSPPTPSPSTILKEDENQWLNAEDFSLSSLFGHLDSQMRASSDPIADSSQRPSTTSDVETPMQCLMSESSLDYVAKFADMAAQMASNGTNKS